VAGTPETLQDVEQVCLLWHTRPHEKTEIALFDDLKPIRRTMGKRKMHEEQMLIITRGNNPHRV